MLLKSSRQKLIFGVIFVLSLLSIFFFGFLISFDSREISNYKPPLYETLTPQTHSLVEENGNYTYTSSDKTFQFSYPLGWRVRKCIEGECNLFQFHPTGLESELASIAIDTFGPASWCDTHINNADKGGRWQEVQKTIIPTENIKTTLVEGIVKRDPDQEPGIYQESTLYIQSEATCYVLMVHAFNNPELYKQLQITRDSFKVLK
jgi:hypothetical protein